MSLLVFLLLTLELKESISVQINVGLTPAAEEGDLVFDLVSHLLDHHFPECHLSMDTDSTDIGPSLQRVFPHQQSRYRPVLVGRMEPTFKVSHQDYRTIWKKEQLYSFRTIPVELKSNVWNGGKCTFTFLLTTNPHQHSLRNLTLHAVSTFRFRNLHDPILIHTTNPHDNPNRILLTDPLNGVTYKLLSQYSAKSHQLKLHNVCHYCFSPTHRVNPAIDYPLFKTMSTNLLYPEVSSDLYGKRLKLAHIESIDLNSARIRGRESFHLLTVEEYLLLDTEKIMNITIEVIVPEFSLEDYYSNGSYTGFNAALVYGPADGSLVQFFSSISIKATAVTDPLIYFQFSFLTRHPRPDMKWYIIIQPYTLGSWSVIFATTLFSALIILLLHSMENKLRGIETHASRVGSCVNILRVLFRELLEQTVTPFPYPSIRAFYSYILLFTLVTTTLYKARIVALLTFPETEILPRNFQELHDSRFYLGTSQELIVFIGYGIDKSEVPMLKSLFKKFETVSNWRECFERAINEDFACITHDFFYRKESVAFVDHNGYPTVRWITENTLNAFTAPAMPNDAIGFKKFNRAMVGIREGGINDHTEELINYLHFLKHYHRKRKIALENDEKILEEVVLSLRNVWPILGMLVLGLCLSVLIFAGEFCVAKCFN